MKFVDIPLDEEVLINREDRKRGYDNDDKFIWSIKRFKTKSNDIDAYYKKLDKLVDEKKLDKEVLGKTDDDEILLISNKPENPDKSICFISAIHGEEPAPAWAILELLEKEDLSKLNTKVSFIPVFNPYGFSHGTRQNKEKKVPNNLTYKKIPKEAKILLKNSPTLKKATKDGFFHLHEDMEFKKAYIYVYGSKNKLAKKILRILSDSFRIAKDDEIQHSKKQKLKVSDGVIDYEKKNDLVDDIFVFDYNKENSISVETPIGDIDKRIDCYYKVIKEIIGYTDSK